VKAPESLLKEVSRDLRPVKPAPLPFQTTLRIAPAVLLISLVLLMVAGPRRDASVLGPALTWGASLAQFAVAFLLVWVFARENTPNRRLPRGLIALILAAGAALVVAVTLWTYVESPPLLLPPRLAWKAGFACGGRAALAGAVLVILCAWFFRRAVTSRPALAGAVFGAGVGIAVNSGWRLACPVSAPSHSLGAHGGAILITVLVGAIMGRLTGYRKVAG
jgi:hypothetical protein